MIKPHLASRFLLGFASTPRVHYAELSVRLIVGAAFVIYAPNLLFSYAFFLFGWVLIITTACLFILPWRWHQRFAQQMVPQAIRYINIIGVCSILLGGLVMIAINWPLSHKG